MHTIKYTFMNKPYPEVFLINVNWHSDQISYMETFYFSVSIALEFKASDMFEVNSPKISGAAVQSKEDKSEDQSYLLVGLVCFVGAHYLSFVKAHANQKVIWKLFDDDKPIFVY